METKNKMSWLEDVRQALQNLGRPSPLSDIYSEIKKIREISPSKDWKAAVRRYLIESSSASDVFKSRFDYFGTSQLGSGIWFLRDNPTEIFQLSEEYSRKEIATVLGEKSLSQAGSYYSKKHDLVILLPNVGSPEHNNFFENDLFHWDSKKNQDINNSRIQEIVNKKREVILFCRMQWQKNKDKTRSYIYCGKLEYADYDESTSKPVHIIFKSIDHTDDDSADSRIKEIRRWQPEKKKYPDITERKGLVISRVGQGDYRKDLLDRWESRCAVKEVAIENILIASHIVPWRDSDNNERLDVGNGILLSPNLDALFDRHLISFTNEGNILISHTMTEEDLINLGIDEELRLRRVYPDMLTYLEKHRAEFNKKE